MSSLTNTEKPSNCSTRESESNTPLMASSTQLSGELISFCIVESKLTGLFVESKLTDSLLRDVITYSMRCL